MKFESVMEGCFPDREKMVNLVSGIFIEGGIYRCDSDEERRLEVVLERDEVARPPLAPPWSLKARFIVSPRTTAKGGCGRWRWARDGRLVRVDRFWATWWRE